MPSTAEGTWLVFKTYAKPSQLNKTGTLGTIAGGSYHSQFLNRVGDNATQTFAVIYVERV